MTSVKLDPLKAVTDDAGLRRKRIVLYNPIAVFFTMPLGLLAIASEFDPAEYEVIIIDGRLEGDAAAAVVAQLDGAICLGVTVLTGAPIADALAVSRAAKAARPDLPVVWGGWHPSLFGTECLDEPSVDVTVQGQGEDTFREIVERIERGEGFDGCKGSCYRSADGTARKNPARPMRAVEGFKPHAFSLIEVERYFDLKGTRQFDYISSQGCNFRCAFCADPFVYGRKWSGFPADRLGAEIEELWQAYRFDDLAFQDENFFTRANRVEAIADEFIRRKLPITWTATMRADQGDRLSEELMAKCRQSGLRRLLVGVESGSQEMIDWMKKDIRLEQVFTTAEKCLRHGISINFPFIVGFPGESDASVAASLDVARRLREMSPTFQVQIFYFKPYPGSPISTAAFEGGHPMAQTLEEWSRFDFIGAASDWVTPEKRRLVERFKFYQQIGYDRSRRWLEPIRSVAKWRCRNSAFGAPIEMTLARAVRKQRELS